MNMYTNCIPCFAFRNTLFLQEYSFRLKFKVKDILWRTKYTQITVQGNQNFNHNGNIMLPVIDDTLV